MNNGYSTVVVLILFSSHLSNLIQPTKHCLIMTNMWVYTTQAATGSNTLLVPPETSELEISEQQKLGDLQASVGDRLIYKFLVGLCMYYLVNTGFFLDCLEIELAQDLNKRYVIIRK